MRFLSAVSLWAAMLGLASLLQACASPAQKLLQLASEQGFSRRILTGKSYQLEAFYNKDFDAAKVLHVYLEGDGLPWSSFTRIANDPTPRNPLMLRLMAKDPSPSLYLGRPCYNGHATDTGCSPLLWTHRRYGPEVVEAMAAALQVFLRENPHPGLVFLGHSGGGALALLLGLRFPSTRAVVTLAGNADIDAWAELHDYSRLQGSFNPADFTDSRFPEIHYLGERDGTIPPALFKPVLQKRRNAEIHTVEGYDHVCCWDKLWSNILKQIP